MSTIALPNAWSITQLVLNYEGEDLSRDLKPFSASVVVQHRMDVESDEALDTLAGRDKKDLGTVLPGFKMVSEGALSVPGKKVEHFEFTYTDDEQGAMRQLVAYYQKDQRIYALVATHVAARFESVRPQMLDLISRL